MNVVVRRAVTTAAAAAALVAGFAAAGSARPAAPASSPTPGLAGKTITLERHMGLADGSADIAVDAKGTAYVGWIGSPNSIQDQTSEYLCVLPAGATGCLHGVQSTADPDPTLDNIARSSAADLRVLIVAGTPTLVWFHDDVLSESGSNGSEISEATVSSTGVLSATSNVEGAPSFGKMLDAEVGPDGQLWTVTYPTGAPNDIKVQDGTAGTQVTVPTPYAVGFAHLAFSHSTPIIAITKAGAETQPIAYTYESGTSWKKFANVANTWAGDQNIGLVATTAGVRLTAATNASTDYPVVAKWSGTGFSPRVLTGDRYKFAPSSHDLVKDASGRAADVSNENNKIAVSNLADTVHAATFRFAAGGIVAGPEPQLGTTPRGHGWVLWGVNDTASGGSGDKLLVAPIRLAGLHVTKTKHGRDGSAVLSGPASCLPASTISVGVAGHAKKGWTVTSRSVKLGSDSVGKTLNGASLTAGKVYQLKGSVVFGKGHKHKTVTAKIAFRSCPNP